MAKSDPNREISIEELESAYLKHVETKLEHILGCLTSEGYQHRAVIIVQSLVDTRGKIEGLRKKALAGKLTLGEVFQHLKAEKKSRKPRRRKVLTRYERILKSFS